MCKQSGPACQCPGLAVPDKVESWDELYSVFDQLKVFGGHMARNHA